MSVLMSDEAVIQRVLDHAEARTTDLGDDVWREPVEHYTSEARLADELELFRRMPMVYCPSAALPEPGSYLARTHAGAPLLAVRGSDGEVRVFHNACRHRGMMLAEGQGKARGGFVCRYHAWAYGLDGALRGMAGTDGFPGVDPAEHGLKQVDAVERGGFVFVTLAPPVSDGALENLPDILTPDQVKVLAWSAREVAAEEALSMGLVSAISEDAEASAMDMAIACAQRSPDAVRGIKRLVNEAWSMSEGDGLRLEAKIQGGVIGRPNQIEAVMANREQRDPEFLD